MDLERQLLLEREMSGQGAIRTRNEVNKAREKEAESCTLPAMKKMAGDGKTAGDLERFSLAVAEFIKEGTGRAGQRHSIIPVLRGIPETNTIAFIGLQVIFDSIVRGKRLTNVAAKVGQSIEDELRFRKFEKENPAFWRTLIKDLDKREHNMQRRRYILIHEMEKGAKKERELEWKPWTIEYKVRVGMQLIYLLESSTDLIVVFRDSMGKRKSKKAPLKITATVNALAWIEDFITRSGVIYPAYLPTIIPPRRWKSPTGGGYYLQGLRPLKLVKVHGQRGTNYLMDLGAMPKQLRTVYASINAVQATPWRINKPVLAIMEQAKASGIDIGKAPRCLSKQVASDMDIYLPLPPKPADIATNEDARTLWRRAAALIYGERVSAISRSLQHVQLLTVAQKFQNEEVIYFPMQLDFRGRMYAVPPNLNPQGNDPAKSLLTFVRAKKLGERGLRWLLIQAANLWGEDKISMDDREQWALDHLDSILETASDPLAHHQWWGKADKPWQFLATCFELGHAYLLNEPTEYVCSLPIMADGTCNGLQHFSAMLLDEAGAKAVNLAPSHKPNDIYQVVADRVKQRFSDVIAMGGEGRTEEERQATLLMAHQWLTWGFDRKATKRAVMIVPYSGTEFAAKDYTIEYIKGRKDKSPFSDNKPAYFFANHVWAAIEEEVVSARLVMNWLRKVCHAVSKKGSPVLWTTPAGLPVKQDYRVMESSQVKTMLGRGIRIDPVISKATDQLDTRSMDQGISPNLIHSYDAASLMLTVVRCLDEGVYDFSMVHDSYGTLAADMDTLGVALRQAFVDIYQTDVMGEFFKSATSVLSEKELAKLPAQPAKGTFVLETVKDSVYFFA